MPTWGPTSIAVATDDCYSPGTAIGPQVFLGNQPGAFHAGFRWTVAVPAALVTVVKVTVPGPHVSTPPVCLSVATVAVSIVNAAIPTFHHPV